MIYFTILQIYLIKIIKFLVFILEYYKTGEPNSGWIHCSYVPEQPRKQFMWCYRDLHGKTKYKPIIGKAKDLV